jgi:hypothetical protein
MHVKPKKMSNYLFKLMYTNYCRIKQSDNSDEGLIEKDYLDNNDVHETGEK